MTYDLRLPWYIKSAFPRRTNDKALIRFNKHQTIFRQDEPADSVFYICTGTVRLSVLTSSGKEAILALLGRDQLVGEGCLAWGARRVSTATAMTETEAFRLDRSAMERMLALDPNASSALLAYVLSRNIQTQRIMVDQLFNSSEKRLAHLLLTISHVEEVADSGEASLPGISQSALGEMIGSSRETVNLLMGKFRRFGHVRYSDGALVVRKSLSSIISSGAHRDPRLFDKAS
jgi:CRP-like cAMP-binding protein